MTIISISSEQFKGLKTTEKIKTLEVLDVLKEDATIDSLMDHLVFADNKTVYHSLINFYVNKSLESSAWLERVLERLKNDLRQAELGGVKPDTYSENSFIGDDGALKTIQSSAWMKLAYRLIERDSEEDRKCLVLLLESPVYYSTVYTSSSDTDIEKLPGFKRKSTTSNYWSALDVFLSMERLDLAEQVWSRNTKKKQYTDKINELISRSLVRGYTYAHSSTEPFRGIYLSQMSQWSEAGKMLSYLVSKSSGQNIDTSSYVSTLMKVMLSGDESFLSDEQKKTAKKHIGSDTWFQVLAQLFSAQHDEQKRFLEDVLDPESKMVLIKESLINYPNAFKEIFEQSISKDSGLSNQYRRLDSEKLKCIESLSLHAPKEFAQTIWSQTPVDVLALSFSKNNPITDRTVSKVCACAQLVNEEIFTDVLVRWSSELNVFPSTHDRSPFHVLITELPANVLEMYLDKMQQKSPQYLRTLLSEQCWTLQHLELRKKGDAFCVAVGDGDPDKLRILLKYAEYQNKERAKDTLKYLRARDKNQHAKAMSTFELLLFEKAISSQLEVSDIKSGGNTKKSKIRL